MTHVYQGKNIHIHTYIYKKKPMSDRAVSWVDGLCTSSTRDRLFKIPLGNCYKRNNKTTVPI